MYKILTAFLLTVLVLFNPISIKAANEFSTSYDVTYSVNEDGSTDVTQDIKLRNLTDKFFPSSFSLLLPGHEVTDVSALDKTGPLEVEVSHEGNNTKLVIKFTDRQVIGLGKEYDWTLKFKDGSISKNLGKIWSINIPKISQQTQVENLNLILSVPVSFGDPDFITHKGSRVSESGGRVNLSFEKNEILDSGISAIFGTDLSFSFETTYSLTNKSLFPAYKKIALPVNFPYQKTFINNITPTPENTQVDKLGNTFAIFKVNPGEEINPKVEGVVKTFLSRNYKETLSEEERENFTKETKHWDENNPVLRAKLVEILEGQNPESSLEKARIINKFVANFLKFDQARLNNNEFNRFGSLTALNNPEKALSAEFVDLESALLRAAGIPSRQVIGFAFNPGDSKPFSFANNNLHTWVEIYEPNQGWFTSDPTWENTNNGADFFAFNDLNHIALAISDGSDDFVLPNSAKANIYEGEVEEKKIADLNVDVKSEILSGLPANAKITIRNLGNTAFPASELEIDTAKILLESNGSAPSITRLVKTPEIPPFGNLEYSFNLRTGAIWHSYQDVFQVKFAGVSDTRVITVTPILSYKIFAIEIFGALTIILLFYILTILIHHKSTKKS